MSVHELAGKPAPRSLLVNIPRLVSAYYTHKPDVSDPAQRVSFGTSGHRGSSLKSISSKWGDRDDPRGVGLHTHPGDISRNPHT
jgi:phosphoglucomutase